MYLKVCSSSKAPELVNVVIEIPQGSSVKYEVDEETGLVFVDRVLYTAMHYPFNYGFIPCTLEEDGDPVDVLVITQEPLHPGVVVEAKPIGLLEMEDEEGVDAKVIAVPRDKVDPRFKDLNDINDLPEILREKIKHFFEHYKELEPGKWVKVIGWRPRSEALTRISMSIERFLKQKQ
ncbi:MAG: inorganic diphosphatase [Sulfolobales archaeon]|nr:inorganic diphosphatase [Sulfolobales archaeon]MCX8199412.1 inorganic diphosphatase [Sulfolobales archaeon]